MDSAPVLGKPLAQLEVSLTQSDQPQRLGLLRNCHSLAVHDPELGLGSSKEFGTLKVTKALCKIESEGLLPAPLGNSRLE